MDQGLGKREGLLKKNSLVVGILCALGCQTLYGMSCVFTKQATNVASELSLLGWRFLVAFVVMNLCVGLRIIKLDLRGKNLKPLLRVALFYPVLDLIGETVGISNTTASESGVFLACIPVAAMIASTLILHKKPSKLQVTGILITIIGVLLTVLAVGVSSSFSVIGYSFLLMAIISYALYAVFVDKATDYTSVEITYIMIVFGAIVFVGLAIIEALIKGSVVQLLTLPFVEMNFLSAILYQGILSSVFAFFLSNAAITRIGVNRMASFIGVCTVVTIIAGTLWLNETFTVWQVVGAAVIIIGVYIANAKVNE